MNKIVLNILVLLDLGFFLGSEGIMMDMKNWNFGDDL